MSFLSPVGVVSALHRLMESTHPTGIYSRADSMIDLPGAIAIFRALCGEGSIYERVQAPTTFVDYVRSVHLSSTVYARVRLVRRKASTSTACIGRPASAPYTTAIWIAVGERICIAVPTVVHFVRATAEATTVHTGTTVAVTDATHIRNCKAPPNPRAIRPAVVGWIIVTSATIVSAIITVCDISAVFTQ